MARASIPPLNELIGLFNDENTCMVMLKELRVFYSELPCSSCIGTMRPLGSRHILRCSRCRNEQSGRAHTFFWNSRLKVSEILRLGYFWLVGLGRDQAAVVTGHSARIVSDFFGHFRQLVFQSLDEQVCVIGGPNIVVEVDESKMGKRKYHRGHQVDGVWLLGGVEKTAERKCFIIPVADRTTETIRAAIERYVAPGSIIRTDCWRAYSFLDDSPDYIHQTVNHSLYFKDPITGVDTNTIEGTWSGLKRKVPMRNRVEQGMEGRVMEFIWRRIHKDRLWEALLHAIRDVHYQ